MASWASSGTGIARAFKETLNACYDKQFLDTNIGHTSGISETNPTIASTRRSPAPQFSPWKAASSH